MASQNPRLVTSASLVPERKQRSSYSEEMALKFTASFSLALFTVFVIVEAGRRQRTFTFDLLKYSNVETYSTYDNTKENEDFLRAHRCRKTRDNGLQCHDPSEANLKNTLRTNELTWLADFRDGVREVEIAVNFPYVSIIPISLLFYSKSCFFKDNTEKYLKIKYTLFYKKVSDASSTRLS